MYGASELSLVIDKADSIEEQDESAAEAENKQISTDDVILEEEVIVSEPVERRQSVRAIEIEDLQSKHHSRPAEALHQPPTSTSTQTVPTEEFPEASVTSTAINQAEDVGKIAQFNVETQQETKIAQEVDACTRSTKDDDDESAKSCTDASRSYEVQQQKECLLAHQQTMSQEEDYEVAMVSGLLPGCVAPAPTPAPSIAPLAETEADPAEDDADNFTEPCENVEQKPEVERKKKRKEKREKEGGEGQSQSQTDADCSNDPEKSKRNAVCPWEDE